MWQEVFDNEVKVRAACFPEHNSQMHWGALGEPWLKNQANICLGFPLGAFRAVCGSEHTACEVG